MIAVIAVCVLGPISAVYVLGWVAAALLPGVGLVLGLTLGLGIEPGTFSLADEIVVALTGALVLAYFALLLWMTCWCKLEVYFATTPWLRHNGRMQAVPGGRKYATRCPFTGHRPSMRCPSCDARVHDSAFRRSDRLISWPVGETVLRWDAAKAATETTEEGGDLTKARRELDRYLDYRGNTLFASCSACCVGCATWQRNFNLIPRLTISLAFASLFFAFIPWGFASFLAGEQPGVKGIGGGGARALQVVAEVLALLYAQTALLVQAQALLRANAFLAQYGPLIPSLKPVLPASRWVDLAARASRPPWEQRS